MDGGRAPRGTFAPVAMAGRRPPVERWLAVVAVALVIVVAKPWPSPDGSDGPGGAGVGAPTRSAPGALATTIPSPSASLAAADVLVSAFCLDTRSWLVASVERWRDQRIRVWRALQPASAASGPDDPAIPIVPVVSEGLIELGWCAPVLGDERPSAPVDVAVWRRSAGGALPIVVDSSRPASDRSPLGELYRPPGGSPTSAAPSWAAGTYVFRWREHTGRNRWFAVVVEIRPRPTSAP